MSSMTHVGTLGLALELDHTSFGALVRLCSWTQLATVVTVLRNRITSQVAIVVTVLRMQVEVVLTRDPLWKLAASSQQVADKSLFEVVLACAQGRAQGKDATCHHGPR